MQEENGRVPWVSFCMSTYKRPDLLRQALTGILEQTFTEFEVVVSDNDPEKSAEPVVKAIGDPRLHYFSNGINLGMIASYNKSIERARTPYIVMITDDDPVTGNFLAEMHALYTEQPGYSMYCGFPRAGKPAGNVETITATDFITEILDVKKTPEILWSSSVMRKVDALAIGGMPDRGSPHLADHAMIAMTGSQQGAVVINRMFSFITLHDNNFSKFNFHYYTTGCQVFYERMVDFCRHHGNYRAEHEVVVRHIGHWFIVNMFNLKKFYTRKKDQGMLDQVNACAAELIRFPFMRPFRAAYARKQAIYRVKKILHLL